MSDSGHRKYDSKDDPEPKDFGRRKNDGDFIITQKKLYNMFCNMKDEIIDLKTTMNNGIVETVSNLSEETEKNSQKIEELKEKIDKHKSYDEGIKDNTKRLITWTVGAGGWLIALLSFLFGQGIL